VSDTSQEVNSAQFPDRIVERTILSRLHAAYPANVDVTAWANEFPALVKEMSYLQGHGLISAYFTDTYEGREVVHAKLTERGIDFLRDDGGLSAILGTVTVKFHDDTIKCLIEARILASDLPPREKQRYVDQLRSLPADATKHLVLKLLEKALNSVPSAWISVQTVLSAWKSGC